MSDDSDSSSRWLLLVHHIPANPSRVRVRIWRRLQGIGAVAIKNSVYLLPNSAESREDFEWLRGEIIAQGGEAFVFTADIGAPSTAEIVDLFQTARHQDWQKLREEAEAVRTEHEARLPLDSEGRRQLENAARLLRGRADRVRKIDFFDSAGRQSVDEELRALARLLDPDDSTRDEQGAEATRLDPDDYRGRTWLTRPQPGVDRMASAWLIRSLIDPEAVFDFADQAPAGGETVPFDMFGVELGHHDNRCTFETIVERFGLAQPALEPIARIVHDLDLRVELPRDADSATLGLLVDGLRESVEDDHQLLEHGMALFEALYRKRS